MRASPAPPAIVSGSPAGFDLKAMGRTLRDDVAADEVLRSVVALLASARSHLRLTVKALVRRGFMADVPIPLETLPPRALTQLYSHLLLQESVFAIVLKSAGAGVDASRAAASSIIGRRIAELDVFMSDQITGGMTCHFSPLEAMYGMHCISGKPRRFRCDVQVCARRGSGRRGADAGCAPPVFR